MFSCDMIAKSGRLVKQNYLKSRAFSLHIPWVIVPIGQNVHQVLGLKSPITPNPRRRDVSIRL